jgi:hypothetical protein
MSEPVRIYQIKLIPDVTLMASARLQPCDECAQLHWSIGFPIGGRVGWTNASTIEISLVPRNRNRHFTSLKAARVVLRGNCLVHLRMTSRAGLLVDRAVDAFGDLFRLRTGRSNGTIFAV